MNNVTLLLHGAYAGSAYKMIFKELKKSSIKNICNVIIVSYISDFKNLMEDINESSIKSYVKNLKVIQVKDLFNPGFFNINRQIYTVKSGLEEISSNEYVIKLRNDQWVDFDLLFELLNIKTFFSDNKQKILTTNCYTRSDRLYHPSDMFLCGWRDSLYDYYDMPLLEQTWLDCELSMICEAKKNPDRDLKEYFICPEIVLFRNYLKKKKWDFRETQEDSLKALRTYCYMVNASDIMLRWNKERPPLFKKGAVIEPYEFKQAPFEGVAEERATYFSIYDINEKMNTNEMNFFEKRYQIEQSKLKNKKKLLNENIMHSMNILRKKIVKHPKIRAMIMKTPFSGMIDRYCTRLKAM